MPRPATTSFTSTPLALTLVLVGATLALSVPGRVAAGIYKCKNGDGTVLYSNSPCIDDNSGSKVNVYTGQSAAPPAVDNNAFSVINQARMLDRSKEQKRRDAAMKAIGKSPDYRTAVQRIDSALAQLDRDESALQSQLGDESVSARWAQEDVASIQAQRAQLLQVRANVVAQMKDAADQALRVRAARAEDLAQEAMARAAAAEASATAATRQAEDAEQRAQQIQQQAQQPKYDPTTDRWCQQLGGVMHCN